jgi:hypothetical protein
MIDICLPNDFFPFSPLLSNAVCVYLLLLASAVNLPTSAH